MACVADKCKACGHLIASHVFTFRVEDAFQVVTCWFLRLFQKNPHPPGGRQCVVSGEGYFIPFNFLEGTVIFAPTLSKVDDKNTQTVW